MAVDFQVQPGEWNEWAGLWFKVLADPLAGPKHYVVTIHPDPLHFRVDRPNGGVYVQTCPPPTVDFATTDWEPL